MCQLLEATQRRKGSSDGRDVEWTRDRCAVSKLGSVNEREIVGKIDVPGQAPVVHDAAAEPDTPRLLAMSAE